MVLSVDACMKSKRTPVGGWGNPAGRYLAKGYYPRTVRVPIEEKKIIFAFLEFYGFLYAPRIALAHQDEENFPAATKHFLLVGISDNEAVRYITASRPATNPLMRLFLRNLRQFERAFNV